MSDLNQRLLAAFQVEYKDHLEHMRRILQTDVADLDELLRRAHNLKGAARAVDLRTVETLAHQLETVFSTVRRDHRQLDRDSRQAIHVVLDGIEDFMVRHSSGEAAAAPQAALDAIGRLLNEPVPQPATEVAPAPTEPAEDLARVSVGNIERLLASVAQVVSESRHQESLTRQIRELQSAAADVAAEWERGIRHTLPRTSPHLDRMDERVRALSRQARQVTRLQQTMAWSLQRQGQRLHRDVQRVLMVPASSVLEGFPKLVRDLARDLDKTVDFHMVGGDVRADRRVLQALKDPLTHLLRNALSHGVESPAERTAHGKPPSGRVALIVEAVGSRLTVRVEDDGRGVDYDKVSTIARKRGLLREGESDLERLLFMPGFSTSQVITEVSGRGFGLSAVAEAARALQGEVRLQPAGVGCVFTLSLPLSLSMQTVLLMQCAGQWFGLAVNAVERLYRMAADQVQSLAGRAVVAVPGAQLPLWSLSHLLYTDDAAPAVHDGFIWIAVVRHGGRRVAVAVDTFAGKFDGVLQDLGPVQPAGLRPNGGMILGDGSICLVLSAADLVEASQHTRQASPQAAVAPAAVPPPARTSCVLVVDDSFTTRTLEKGILEANGFRVLVAVDGVEALQVLRVETVDLVIADIQMPRMDGFALLEAIKADARLSGLPIILVTSLERREDQERGLRLGADAYIVKRKFEQRDLLETVRQLL